MLKDLLLSKLNPKQKNILWIVFVIIYGAISFFGAQLVSTLIVIVFLSFSGSSKQQITDIFTNNKSIQLIVYLLVGVITVSLILRFLKWRKINPKKFLMLENKPTPSKVVDVVLLYGLYFLVLIVVTIILGAFTGVNVNQTQDLGIVKPDDVSGKFMLFFMIVLMPPVIEEILFRGFLFNMFKKYTSYIVSFILTCLLFGSAHLEYGNLNWIAAIDTLIFSGFLIYISQRHQSLYSSMILHAIKNGLAFYVLFVR